MLLVKTFVANSEIHGLGLFAAEDIPKGTEIWRFVPGIDIKIPPSVVENLDPIRKEYILNYTYVNKVTGEHILPADSDRYTNHSKNPNTQNIGFAQEEGVTVATRNIKKGEEITTNYNEFENGTFNY
jgi:uncharacterized protein